MKNGEVSLTHTENVKVQNHELIWNIWTISTRKEEFKFIMLN